MKGEVGADMRGIDANICELCDGTGYFKSNTAEYEGPCPNCDRGQAMRDGFGTQEREENMDVMAEPAKAHHHEIFKRLNTREKPDAYDLCIEACCWATAILIVSCLVALTWHYGFHWFAR